MWTVAQPSPAWSLDRTAQPEAALIELSAAKAHLRIEADNTDEDEYLLELAAAVADVVQHEANQAPIEQTWALVFHYGFPAARSLRLPWLPLVSVDSIAYVDTNGDSQTMATSAYEVHTGMDGMVALAEGEVWPSTTNALAAATVTYTCGYGTAPEDTPERLRHMALLLLAHYYEMREPVITGTIATPIPMTYKRMLAGVRRHTF